MLGSYPARNWRFGFFGASRRIPFPTLINALLGVGGYWNVVVVVVQRAVWHDEAIGVMMKMITVEERLYLLFKIFSLLKCHPHHSN